MGEKFLEDFGALCANILVVTGIFRPIAMLVVAWGLSVGLSVGQQIPVQMVAGGPAGITILFEDARGRLWLGSGKGVHYFDGSRFFGLSELGMPATATVLQFAEDSDGGIWMGSNQGLYRYEGGRVELVRPGVAQSVVVAGAGVMAVAMGTGEGFISPQARIVRVSRSEGWKVEEMFTLDSQGAMSRDREGNLVFSCPPGWCEMKGEDVVRWRPGSGAPRLIRHAGPTTEANHAQVLRDGRGCVWAGRESNVLYQCPGDKEVLQMPDSLVAHAANWIAERSDGVMAILSQSKIAIGRPGAFRGFTTANGLPAGSASHFGRDGTLWIGDNRGLHRWSYPGRMEMWSEREGSLAITSVARFEKTGETFAGAVGGLLKLAENRRSWNLVPGTEELRRIEGIEVMGDGNSMLVGLPAVGAAIYDRAGRRLAITEAPSPSAWHFGQARNGEIWTGGNAVGRLQRSGSRLKIVKESLPGPENRNALDMEVERRTGTLWGCYAGGLMRRAGEAWERITTADGLQQDSCRSLAPTPDGNVWYGYNTVPGFALVRPGPKVEVKQFGTSEGIGQGLVHFLDVDARGWLWRGASDGLHVADAKMAESGVWLHLDASDGLPGTDMNQQAFYSDPDGSVWWGADNTLVHFEPAANFLNWEEAPKVYLSSVAWEGQEAKPLEWLAGKELPAGAALRFQLGSLESHGRKLMELRYRVGAAEWQRLRGFEFEVAQPEWGEQVLEVQGRFGPLGKWSPSWRQTIMVARPLWATWPVMGGAGLLLLGLGYWGVRRKRAEEAELPDIADWRVAALMPEAHELIGVTLDGRFRAERIVARGGFATVLAGVDLSAAEPVASAIKVFRPELRGEWLDKRFAQEVSALLAVKHPNVVQILGHGWTPSGTPYLAMEFIEGVTLRQHMQQKERLARGEVGRFVEQIGRALAVIHGQGIYHRDLKPDNIMLRSGVAAGEELVLIDFSIAIVRDPDQTVHGLSRAAGTLLYMAPEQAVGFACAASDIYSLAKVLLEMLSGRTVVELFPDAALDLPGRVRKYLEESPDSPSGFGLSSEAIELIARALEFDPMKRPADALRFVEPLVRDLGARGASA